MPYFSDGSTSGFIDDRTLQLITLNRACELHLKGLRSPHLTIVGQHLGFKCRTVKALKIAVQQELDSIKDIENEINDKS